ncbi:MAG: flagellar basal body rod protein FlgB [Bdellovibrionales bacterium]|nr:flagellar basal body rod protein FlgB [Bdellovibrionales bacterium]
MSSSTFDRTTQALLSSSNLRLQRQNVISSNIANAETPGYKAQKLDFEEALSRAIDHEKLGKVHTSDPGHFLLGQGALGRVRADVYDNPDVNVTNDGNTVDLEKEMAELSENSIVYKAALQLINKKLASLRYAVTEGAR